MISSRKAMIGTPRWASTNTQQRAKTQAQAKTGPKCSKQIDDQTSTKRIDYVSALWLCHEEINYNNNMDRVRANFGGTEYSRRKVEERERKIVEF